MDLKMDLNPKASDESSAKSPSDTKTCTFKHFKKSMIVDYEKIEPTILPTPASTAIPTTEDSQSSVSSSSSSSSTSNSSNFSSSSSSSSSSVSSSKSITSFSDPVVTKKIKNDQTDTSNSSMFSTYQKNSPDYMFKNEKNPSKPTNNELNVKNETNKKNSEHKSESKESKPKSSKPIKQSSLDNKSKQSKKTYCICRTSDTQRFMIACDKCDEWFHGDCVGVSQSLSKKIKAFFCHICRRKKPSLAIRYKSKFEEFLKNNSSHNNQDLHSSFIKFQKENRARERKEHELNSKSSSNTKKTDANKAMSSSTSHSDPTHKKHSHATMPHFDGSPSKSYGQSHVSGDDLLNFVSAINQLGADTGSHASISNQSIELAVRKRKLSENVNNKSKTNSENEDSDQSRSKKVRDYSDATSSTVDSSDQFESSENDAGDNEITDETENESFVDEASENDSDYTEFTSDGSRKHSQNHSKKHLGTKKPGDRNQIKPNKISSGDQKKCKISSKNAKGTKGKSQNKRAPAKNVQRSNRKPTSSSNSAKHEINQRKIVTSTKEEKDEVVRVGPVQCLGPGCVREALKKSKYCSEDCGLSLAKNRLVHFLKSRIQQYNESPTYSKILNEAELDRINSEIGTLRSKLKELENKHLELDSIIDQARTQAICGKIEKEREQSCADSNEAEIYCVTCGSLHTEKFALKHMEKCFSKIESQASFGSYFKTHIEGTSMFCDYYNTQTKMYCKRLKVMCPEHEKEKKINEDEVCGCPLPNTTNIIEDSKQICLASKRTCSIHYKWEKLRRAHIDLEKLRIWLKLEELLEQKRINETSLNQRASLLSILLHQTKYNSTNEPGLLLTTDTNEITKNDAVI